MAELGIAGSVVGIVSLGIQVCDGLIRYYSSWKDAPNKVKSMCQSVKSLEESLNRLKLSIREDGEATQAEAGVQEGIISCKAGIDKLQQELNKVQEIQGSSVWSKIHGQGRRLLYPFRDSTLSTLKEIIADIRENLSLAVELLHLNRTTEHGEQLGHLADQFHSLALSTKAHHNAQERETIIEWLSSMNFLAAQNDIHRRRQEGTGEWLFKTPEYEAWLNGNERILWCSGSRKHTLVIHLQKTKLKSLTAGAGKTILASAIVNHFEISTTNAGIGLAFIYCNYKERDSQTFINLISSLIQQLVSRLEVISDEVRTIYQKHNSQKTRPSEKELSALFNTLVTKFPHIYVVIDALDESHVDTRDELVATLRLSSPNVRLLCTSRHLGDIEDLFKDAPHLEIRASDEDITKYLTLQIQQVPKLRRFCHKSKDLETCIVDKLVEKANGMFLLAELHLESLKSKTDIKRLRKSLDILPEARDDVYNEAMERIQRQPEDEARLAMTVLSWITHAVRPLKVGEIQHAVAVTNFEPDDTTIDEEGLTDESDITTACGGLVVIDQDSRIVRLVHYTTQEYFEKHRSELFPTAHTDIAIASIRYLSMDQFRNGACQTESEFRSWLSDLALSQYAVEYWGDHVVNALNAAVEEYAFEFLNDGNLTSAAAQIAKYASSPYSFSWEYEEPSRVPGIIRAANFGLDSLIQRLLKLGNSVEGKGYDGETALYVATAKGNVSTVSLLLKSDADMTVTSFEGRTPLYCAAANGHDQVVQLLLENGADFQAKVDWFGQTALHGASQEGHLTTLKLLVQKGADLEAKDARGETVLCVASGAGHLAIVQLLLENGADLEAEYASGQTALFAASEAGHLAIVQLLLENGADFEPKNKYCETALHVASRKGHLAIVQLLLENGADSEAKDACGRTVLYAAVANGHLATVQLLLENRPDFEAKDTRGKTVLVTAIEKGHLAIVQLLLENGADSEAKDTCGRTVLYKAVANGHLATTVQLLLENGADVHATCNQGKTALFRVKYDDVTELLLKYGANINHQDELGRTPLHLAARLEPLYGVYDGFKIISLLLDQGADLDAVDSEGKTAGYFTCVEAAMKLMVSRGLNIDHADENGKTILHCFSDRRRRNSIGIIGLLLNEGADIHVRDTKGRTALYYAETGDVVQLLLKHGAQVQVRDNAGDTPLHVAASRVGREYRHGVRESVKELTILLEAGADVSARNNFNQTALYNVRSTEILQLLVRHGAGIKDWIDYKDGLVIEESPGAFDSGSGSGSVGRPKSLT
ncbi:hypothetical protein HYFRA_00012749 [Hymenoscyphus fraxineus]|uniref:Ankyrin n=1 Tax=Hymenoscyphus fraxineus TaxID=746836 RepID=A0A9N9PYB9_9HELO|nr:hypothetical protein HYFRA_00012749 [Hymenoscyphus fraxineus]